MLLQLGTYKFEALKLPQSWTIDYGTNYAKVPIIDGKPVVQKTGEKLVEHDITALFADEFCTPKDELDALQKYRRNGTVLQVTGGNGTNYGKYVITDISVIHTRALDSTGYISAITASIKLLEYNTTKTVTAVSGEALSSNGPYPVEPLDPIETDAISLQNSITLATLKTNSIVANSKKSNKTLLTRIKRLCSEAKSAWTSVNSKIQKTKKIVRRAKELKNTVDATKEAIEEVKEACEAGDLDALYAANTKLESAAYLTNGAGSWVASFVGSKEGGK
jgi:phage protein U